MNPPFTRWAPPNSRLFLVGFMGAGKTVVGRALAARLNCSFRDLDTVVETLAGRTIAEIFAREGESAFRSWEYKGLQTLPEPAVVALGGGAFIQEPIRRSLPRLGRSVYLAWPFPLLWSRIAGDHSRPLAADRQQAETLFYAREPIYRLADLVWEPPKGIVPSPEEIAQHIEKMVTTE